MLRVKIDEVVQEQDINQIIKESIIRFGDKYNKPEPLIKMVDENGEYNYMNAGGISGVFGKQKSRKTFYLSNIMAAAVGSVTIDEKVKGYTDGKKHLWFDTEQSKYEASWIPFRIVRKLGLSSHPTNFELYSLKKYTTEDRIKIIEDRINNTENLGLVVIDGVRDLTMDFNNLSECTTLLNRLMSWVDTKNCHICLALHLNPGKKGDEEKPRGHLGTEVQNKVESSVVIEKKGDISVIKPRDFRHKDIEPFGMMIDESVIPWFIKAEYEDIGVF